MSNNVIWRRREVNCPPILETILFNVQQVHQGPRDVQMQVSQDEPQQAIGRPEYTCFGSPKIIISSKCVPSQGYFIWVIHTGWPTWERLSFKPSRRSRRAGSV